MRNFCASHTVKRVKGARLGNTAAMMHHWWIVDAGGIQKWHCHYHYDGAHSIPHLLSPTI
jgi:hypothetical protein